MRNQSGRKTIILLSAKRCGSTALFKSFQKHPNVGCCHIDSKNNNWEPNFWNLAARAINGDHEPFENRFSSSHPFLTFPSEYSIQNVFKLWNQILDNLGPVVFDKSPQYLGNKDAINLLNEYIKAGNDVRIICQIRDAKDAINSQFNHWSQIVHQDTPKKREQHWLFKYDHLERFRCNSKIDMLFQRYEDFTYLPRQYFKKICSFCDIKFFPECVDHIKPVHIGRYYSTTDKNILLWKFSKKFQRHLEYYGYN